MDTPSQKPFAGSTGLEAADILVRMAVHHSIYILHAITQSGYFTDTKTSNWMFLDCPGKTQTLMVDQLLHLEHPLRCKATRPPQYYLGLGKCNYILDNFYMLAKNFSDTFRCLSAIMLL